MHPIAYLRGSRYGGKYGRALLSSACTSHQPPNDVGMYGDRWSMLRYTGRGQQWLQQYGPLGVPASQSKSLEAGCEGMRAFCSLLGDPVGLLGAGAG